MQRKARVQMNINIFSQEKLLNTKNQTYDIAVLHKQVGSSYVSVMEKVGGN